MILAILTPTAVEVPEELVVVVRSHRAAVPDTMAARATAAQLVAALHQPDQGVDQHPNQQHDQQKLHISSVGTPSNAETSLVHALLALRGRSCTANRLVA